MRAVLNMLGFTSGGGLAVGLGVLACLEDVAPNDEFLVLLPNVASYDLVVTPRNAVKHVFDVSNKKYSRRLWIDHVATPLMCKRYKADVLFSMANFGPYHAPCPHIVGIHSPYLTYPVWPIWGRLSLRDRLFLRAQSLYFSVAMRHANRFCALTKASARRLAESCSLAPERISVVPNADPPDAYFETPDVPRLREVMTSHPAALRLCYPALAYANKNHEALPRAVQILRDTFAIDDIAIFVTVEPTDSINAKRFLSAVESLGLGNQIINLGRLKQSEVPTVLRHCHGLLMPTLLEVLSLSYLEAMRFGVPILTSDYDFAREVCGDAALYFDPLDPVSIASAVARLACEPELAGVLRDRAARRISQCAVSWSDVTRRYVAILREACS